jgi:hypothetical protein
MLILLATTPSIPNYVFFGFSRYTPFAMYLDIYMLCLDLEGESTCALVGGIFLANFLCRNTMAYRGFMVLLYTGNWYTS